MFENPNKDVIEQLERLDFLLEEALKCDEYIHTGISLEYGNKLEYTIQTIDDLKGAPSVFKKFPVFPIDQTDCLLAKEAYEKKKKILTYLLAVTVVALLIFFLSKWSFINTIASVGIIATIIFYFNFAQSKKNYKEKEAAYTDSVNKSKQSLDEFEQALRVYESEKENGIQAARKFMAEYEAAYQAYESLMEEYQNKKISTMETLVTYMDEAKTIDFVPQEYYGFVKPIITLLKSGRAESYKEALNMAIEEDRQAQIEAARREEEAKRTRIMQEQAAAEQRRAEEQARHNREMEYQQQMQAKMAIEEQNKLARDAREYERKQSFEAKQQADKAASEARKQANATRMAGVSKCASCANSRHCPSHIKNNGSGLTCGGYRPYGAK